MNEFLIIILLFTGSLLITKTICFFAIKQQWFDIPEARSSHSAPTPKCGGAAFVITYLSAISYTFYQNLLLANEYLALLIGLLIAALGFIDDFKSLGIKVRIFLHLFAVLLCLYLLGGPPDLTFFTVVFSFKEQGLVVIGYLLSAWVFVWVINLYNFMDGIDGLAALEAIFVSVAAGFFVWSAGGEGESFLLFYLAAAVLGFLLMNLPLAKIFMGDVGSNFIGFTLATLGLITIAHGLMDVWTWGILLGVFVVDGTGTLLQRVRSKEIWYHAHRSHAYQKAAILYASHGKVDAVIILINCFWLFPLAYLNFRTEGWGIAITLLAYLPLMIVGRHFRKL